MSWYFQNSIFISDFIKDNIGFVYQITDKQNGKKYIGKKLLVTTVKKPPLKGKIRKRILTVETDWKSYYGSNEEIKEIVKNEGPERFHREILVLCKSKSELAYREAEMQFKYEVLLRDDYYNNFIGCKINGNNLKDLKYDE